MRRLVPISLSALAWWFAAAPPAGAQVFIRAPFVRVQVGPGVAVRAPFFSFYAPPAGPVYVPGPAYGPSVVIPPPSPYLPPATTAVPPADPQLPATPPATPPATTLPMPKVLDGPPTGPPAPPGQVVTLEQFAKTFQAKAGAYEVEVLNPVTKQPTKVRFTLPEGTPKRVEVRPREIEFRYGPFNFVRIEFDNDGAQVVTRLR